MKKILTSSKNSCKEIISFTKAVFDRILKTYFTPFLILFKLLKNFFLIQLNTLAKKAPAQPQIKKAEPQITYNQPARAFQSSRSVSLG